ncbi:MAG: energy transducer TonB [Bacteroidota bacterium]|nr:energy transducer TonB [Bacteroidota bacterium]
MKNKILLLSFFLLTSLIIKAQAPPPPPPPPAPGTHYTRDTAEVFSFAETMPEFPYKGGFQGYLSTHVKYPKIEKEAGKQGTVYISFVIEKDGSITNVKEAKGVPGAPGLTAEGIRVISGMPNWTPGTMDGNPVRIEMKQPIRFVLTDANALAPITALITAPSFVGGDSALVNYIKTNLIYPKKEKKKKIEGTVVIGFYVETDGSVTGIQVVSEVPDAPGFSKEAMRLVKAMPKWNPGKTNGVNERKWVLVSVKFQL